MRREWIGKLAAALTGAVALGASGSTAIGFTQNPATVYVNEIHYDNSGADVGEVIEVAGPAGTDLTGWRVVLYNGSGGVVYDDDPLAGPIPDQAAGMGAVSLTYPANGLQNGAPDGVALVDPAGTVVQFLSYEGSFAATAGPANGLTSSDIGVTEAGTEAAGTSLRLSGTGRAYQDFAWQPSATASFGAPNDGQTFTVAGADQAPTVSSTAPADGATGVAADANITIAFSEPVDVTGDVNTLTCSQSGVVATAANGGPVTFTLDPATDLATGETCTLTIVAARVNDQDAIDPPDVMSADRTIGFTVAAPACSAPDTAIGAVQGQGSAAAVTGPVTVQGVVVSDTEGPAPTLRGFSLQDAGDGDPLTSDAIFVFTSSVDSVALGHTVQVHGVAAEFQDQTQLAGALVIERCDAQPAPRPAAVELPVPAPVGGVPYLERYEGMLVRFPQTLTVTEHFQLGRFGQVVVSSGGRLPQPTQVATPGDAARAVQAANDLNRLIVDDPLQSQNPDPILFGRLGNPLSATNTLRGGDTVADLTGVLTYTWAGNAASGNAYRLRPVGALTPSGPGGPPSFAPTNPRPSGPPAVGGKLKVASFNVLNYFLTLDDNTPRCGPAGFAQECRGAESAAEFQRQRDKLLGALERLDGDVVGLIELENTPGVDPLGDIVAGLNARVGTARYAAVDTGVVGTDTIRVGVLYDQTVVAPVGAFATLTSAVDPRFEDNRNRPVVAQTFRDLATGGRLTIAVAHLKSKGASELGEPGSVCLDIDPANDVPDCDRGDGQGYWNVSRTRAAQATATWLAADPTGSGDADIAIVGDLNAYAKEDPVTTLARAGYVDTVPTDPATGGYSFAFDGQWGSLDHALATPSLAAQVTGGGEFHINADEPSVLDYNTNFKSPGQLTQLYAPDEFRTADHDPLVVGATPRAPYPTRWLFPPVAQPPTVTRVRAGLPLPLTFSLGGFRGLGVFAGGSPRWEVASCSAPAPTGELVAPARPFAGTTLRYVRRVDLYTSLVETRREWAGRCLALNVQLDDTTVRRAYVQFVR